MAVLEKLTLILKRLFIDNCWISTGFWVFNCQETERAFP